MIALSFDPAFGDFNFAEYWDPALRSGPSNASLCQLVYKARRGDRFATRELAETMAWTLRPETWECFQRKHGHRPASHRDWFYAKLMQFFDILLYDELTVMEESGHSRKLEPEELLTPNLTITNTTGPYIQPDELEEALQAERHAEYHWYGLVQQILGNPADRMGSAQSWLRDQMAPSHDSPTRRSGWAKNQERDQIILNCLNRGMQPLFICEELDRLTIPTLPFLQNKGVPRWKDGWENAQTRNAIQQLFAKVPTRRNVVKPPDISK